MSFWFFLVLEFIVCRRFGGRKIKKLDIDVFLIYYHSYQNMLDILCKNSWATFKRAWCGVYIFQKKKKYFLGIPHTVQQFHFFLWNHIFHVLESWFYPFLFSLFFHYLFSVSLFLMYYGFVFLIFYLYLNIQVFFFFCIIF